MGSTTRNRLQIQLDAQQGSVKGTVKTGVNVISSGRYAPQAVEPGVLLEVQRVLGEQKRGEVHVLSAIVVFELLTDFRVPDFVLSPVAVGASRRLSSKCVLRLSRVSDRASRSACSVLISWPSWFSENYGWSGRASNQHL